MSCAVGSGRDAEIPKTDTPSIVSPSAAFVSATNRAIDTSAGPTRPGNCMVGDVALGTAHVVVQDLVEPQADGLGGQVDLVLAYLGVGEVGERRRAVRVDQRRARWVEHDHLVAPVLHRPTGQRRIEEVDESPDDPHPEPVQFVDRLPGVVVVLRGAAHLGERHVAGVPDVPGLVLDVELHGVDAALRDEVEDLLVDGWIGPVRRSDVDCRRRRMVGRRRRRSDADNRLGGDA